MKKRWISLLLALVMVIGLFPAVLAAETFPLILIGRYPNPKLRPIWTPTARPA